MVAPPSKCAVASKQMAPQSSTPLMVRRSSYSSGNRSGVPRTRGVMVVTARVMPPKGVSEPKRVPVVPPAMFGFVENAEKWNSRAAMVGCFDLIKGDVVHVNICIHIYLRRWYK